MATLVPYLSWQNARQVAALPRPTPAELRALTPGTRAVVAARLPANAPTGPAGLALYYVERQAKDNKQTPPPTTSSSSQWQLETPPPTRMDMVLEDETQLTVQISPQTSFWNNQTVELPDTQPLLRHVGYLPGQTLAVDGTWEGNGLFTAQALYAGRIQDYVAYVESVPGNSFLIGLVCVGTALGLFLLGLIMRILGK